MKWCTIAEAPLYDVSDSGLVRRKEECKIHSSKDVLKLRKVWTGYLQAKLTVKGKHVHRYVHRLVLAAFVGPLPEGKQVNHKNGIKTDNRVENLEYVTSSENNTHAYRVLGKQPLYGEDAVSSRLTDAQAEEIRQLHAQGMNYNQLGKKFGVHRGTPRAIILGLTRTHPSTQVSSHQR